MQIYSQETEWKHSQQEAKWPWSRDWSEQPQAQECWGSWGPGVPGVSSSRSSRSSVTPLTSISDFGLCNRERIRFCCVKPHSPSTLLQKPQKRMEYSQSISPSRPNPACLGMPTGLPQCPWDPAPEGKAVGLCWLAADTLCQKERSTRLHRSPFGIWFILWDSSSTGRVENDWE